MQRIAFLGLGAMGARMAANLLDAGHPLTVWNRTAAAVQPLAARGATPAATPRQAAADADLVFVMVRDDDAAQAVWGDAETGALGGVAPDAIGVDCSTLSVGGTDALESAFAQAGRRFIAAPVAGSRPQAEARALVFIGGGAAEDIEAARPALLKTGASVHHAGPPRAAAAVKLIVNAGLGVQAAWIAEMIAFAETVGVEPQAALSIFGETAVASPAAKGLGALMTAANFTPQFPIDLMAKDFRLLGASAPERALPVSGAAAGLFSSAVDAGMGGRNISGVVAQARGG